jgi:hypothetical protein
MNASLNLRPAQPVAVANATRSQALLAGTTFRAALLGMIAVLGTASAALAQKPAAQQPQWVQTKQADAQSLWLTIDNPEQKAMQMQVVNVGTNDCLANELSHNPSYGCKLNFSTLPTGQYAVLLRVGRERYRYNVQVQKQPATSTIVVQGLKRQTADTLSSASL